MSNATKSMNKNLIMTKKNLDKANNVTDLFKDGLSKFIEGKWTNINYYRISIEKMENLFKDA